MSKVRQTYHSPPLDKWDIYVFETINKRGKLRVAVAPGLPGQLALSGTYVHKWLAKNKMGWMQIAEFHRDYRMFPADVLPELGYEIVPEKGGA